MESNCKELTNGKILLKAMQLINGNRQEEYGSPTENFTRISDLWSAYLGLYIAPHQVANCMILLKLSRISTGNYKEDSYIDIAGYAGLANDLHREGI